MSRWPIRRVDFASPDHGSQVGGMRDRSFSGLTGRAPWGSQSSTTDQASAGANAAIRILPNEVRRGRN